MTKLNILVSLLTDANDYQLEQAASAQSAAIQLGASVQIIYSGNDAVQQTQQILGFIQNPAKRPDAILVEPVGTGMARSPRLRWPLASLGRLGDHQEKTTRNGTLTTLSRHLLNIFNGLRMREMCKHGSVHEYTRGLCKSMTCIP